MSFDSSILDTSFTLGNPIPTVINNRPQKINPHRRKSTLITIKRSNKLLTAVQMPVVVNLNPRSLYNKSNEFKTMINQLDCSLCFISESWESESKSLEDLINMENFRVVTNVVQRNNRGGKPALFISEKHFYVRDKELCPNLFSVPIGAAWKHAGPY